MNKAAVPDKDRVCLISAPKLLTEEFKVSNEAQCRDLADAAEKRDGIKRDAHITVKWEEFKDFTDPGRPVGEKPANTRVEPTKKADFGANTM